jgi:hypothetical protein
MIITDILFGIRTEDMEEIRELLEALLGTELLARSGLHRGEYYTFPDALDEFLYLQYNEDFEDGEEEQAREPDFPEYPLILYIQDEGQHPGYLAAIEARPDVFVKLRTEDWQLKR